MKRRKLKFFVLPTVVTSCLLLIVAGIMLTKQGLTSKDKEALTYVSNVILNNEVAVINEQTRVINPYTDQATTIGKSYYDYKSDAKDQEKSIIYHDNTYMQNSGIDFVNENVFEVVSILNGTVTDIKEDETLGKIVEIKHDNDYISIYQSLSEISVKKGDNINQGQVIGKSGTNELDKDLGNHLHFELYVNGQVVNPSLYLDKDLQTTDKKKSE